MSITWGGSHNGVKIGVEPDSMPVADASTTQLRVAVDVYIYRSVNITDSSNRLSWSGGAVTDGSDSNLDLDGSGTKKIQRLTGQYVTLQYGSPTTATVSVRLEDVNYAGSDLTVSKTITYPARPYTAPAAPTGVSVARNSDTSHTISWTINATTGAPWNSLTLERWDFSTNLWTTVQVFNKTTGNAPTAVNYTDTGTIPNHRYQYRLKASNTAGSSGYATTGLINTTPIAPATVSGARSGATIVLTWANSPAIESGYYLERAENGVWQAGGITVPANTTSYIYSGLNSSVTHRFRVSSLASSGTTPGVSLTSVATLSNDVQLLAKPNPPTSLSPSGEYFDKSSAKTFTWSHNPVDTSVQSAYEIQYRAIGAGSWTTTGKITSGTSAHTFAANTIPSNGVSYEWQVRTWGAYAVDPAYSDWSASATFTTSAVPVLSGLTPTEGAVLNTGVLTLGWTYTDAEATPQSRFSGTLSGTDGSSLQIDVMSSANSYVLPVLLSNSTSYTLTWQVYDGHSLPSNVITRHFSTSFSPPMTPSVTTTWVEETGSVIVQLINPAVVAPKVATLYNDVYRKTNDGEWVLLARNVPPNSSVTDYLPVIGQGTNSYKAIAISATPTSAESAAVSVVIDCPKCHEWFWFNYGPNFSTFARARGNPDLKIDYARAKTVRYFAGRKKPVMYSGEARAHTLDLSVVIEGREHENEKAFSDLNDTSDVVCYRDAWGRRIFVTVGDVSLKQMGFNLMEMSTQMTEVDYVG